MAESRKVVNLCGAAGIALVALTSGALADGYAGSVKDAPADEGRKFTYSFTATGTSDYVFRGISQTDNDPTIQGAINIGYGIFYAGVWASGLDFDAASATTRRSKSTTTPASSRLGVRLTFDFGIIYYAYPGATRRSDPELDYSNQGWRQRRGLQEPTLGATRLLLAGLQRDRSRFGLSKARWPTRCRQFQSVHADHQRHRRPCTSWRRTSRSTASTTTPTGTPAWHSRSRS